MVFKWHFATGAASVHVEKVLGGASKSAPMQQQKRSFGNITRELSEWVVGREKLIQATRKILPVLTDRGRFIYAEAWAMDADNSGLKCYDTFFDDSFKRHPPRPLYPLNNPSDRF